ncbi:unnamed protein product [Paramecium pentaurelia]|uniref:Uncharacterized protein n=1 Tax=Paramecium pentaurelia TaxID=43138 RepID=A0A8S1SAN1_9CILI|nr:unnamed protein product [Paramecium pentaurelia]
MYLLMNQGHEREYQPHSISVNVVVNLEINNLNFTLSIEPEISFNIFAQKIKEQIFAQRMKAQYEEKIEWQLGNGSNLQENDGRTLQSLGFTNNCTLYVRLKLKKMGAISVNVVVNLEINNLNLSLSINPEIPFYIFAQEIKEQIFAQRMQPQYEEKIECQLGNGSNLQENDRRTLQSLGFTNNCTLYVRLKLKKMGAISVNVVVNLEKANLNLSLSIDPEIPFYIFVQGIIEQVFSQPMQPQFEEEIEWQLGNGSYLQENDERTIQSLGFKNNCTLYGRLKRKNMGFYKKKLYKVLVVLDNIIELFIEQYQLNPVSCLFHDILIELFKNQQLKFDRPFAFFINETEINPFDIRQIRDFETSKGIILKLIVPNKEVNKDSMEKYQFALNFNNLIKPSSRKIIKIEQNNDIEMFAYNDYSLFDIIQVICKDLKIYPYKSINYYINNEQFQESQLKNAYAINNIKVNNQNTNETGGIVVFKVIGDIYKKLKIRGYINDYEYNIEEFMSTNTSMTEFLKYVKFKIFGPKQIDFKQTIIGQDDFEARVSYETIEK